MAAYQAIERDMHGYLQITEFRKFLPYILQQAIKKIFGIVFRNTGMSGQKFLAYIGILVIEKIKNRNDGTVMLRSALIVDIFQQIGNTGIFRYLVSCDDDTKFFLRSGNGDIQKIRTVCKR